MKKPIYTVHAYRFGDRERHSYIVGLYSDDSIALFEAKREEIWRGGKYECEVCEWIPDAPSDDNSPGMNHRIVKALPAVSTLVSRGR